MSANCINGQKIVLISDENTVDRSDQSIITLSKQSSTTLSSLYASQENHLKIKPLKTQKSLLSLTPKISQRRTSKSFVDQTQTIEEESYIQAQCQVFNIFWYDPMIDHKYVIPIKACSDITIKELITLAIHQFNKDYSYLQTPLNSESIHKNLFELYIPKKKKGNPNEDFPSFAPQTLLNQTNQIEFALKVTIQPSTKYSTSLPNSKNSSAVKQKERVSIKDPHSSHKKKSFIEKIFFCCSKSEDI